MTTKVLTGAYPAGYTLEAPITTLSIAASGYVGGHGVATLATATASYAVVNDGIIKAAPHFDGYGVYLAAGGSVTNGGTLDTSASISGGGGVEIAAGSGLIRNFGTIEARAKGSQFGVYLKASGSVINGGRADTTALIEAGGVGVMIHSATGALTNFGTITSGQLAVQLYTGATVTNGSASDTTALIEGVQGLAADTLSAKNPPTTITNFGTIHGLGTIASDFGIAMLNSGAVTNGGGADATALIEGLDGVVIGVDAVVTVTNFGTIAGLGGPGQPPVAVEFAVFSGPSPDRLVVEAGSAFVGAVLGGGGILDLATGMGKLTGLLADGDVTVSGSMAPTTFTNFGTVVIGSAASFTTVGAVTIDASRTVTDAGALKLGAAKGVVTNAGLIETAGAGVLTIAGTLDNTGTIAANGGTLTVNGAVTGAGVAAIKGGTLDLASSFAENVTFSGTKGVLVLAQSQGYAGTVTGFSKSGATTLDLVDIGFVASSEATFSGTKTGGLLTVTDGTHTARIVLGGDYLSSTFVASSDGHGGVDVAAVRTKSAAPTHGFISAMAGLGGPAGAAVHAGDARTVHEPVLANPRTMTA